MIKTQFQTQVIVFWIDNGNECVKFIFEDYLLENGIIHQFSCFDTPQQNGTMERKNRHLMEVVRAIMFTLRVLKSFWEEATVMTYLINRMLAKILGFETPINHFSKVYPPVKILFWIPQKNFGCKTFVHIHKEHRTKLDPCVLKCVFVGYSPTQKGYKCYNPIPRKIFISMDVNLLWESTKFIKNILQMESGWGRLFLVNFSTCANIWRQCESYFFTFFWFISYWLRKLMFKFNYSTEFYCAKQWRIVDKGSITTIKTSNWASCLPKKEKSLR